MKAKAIQRVLDDKRARERRMQSVREKSAEQAEMMAQLQAERAEEKAEAERIERELPFNDEVARRLEAHQNN